jgi:hypothetical protein
MNAVKGGPLKIDLLHFKLPLKLIGAGVDPNWEKYLESDRNDLPNDSQRLCLFNIT